MKATIRSFFLTILLTIPFLSDAQPVTRSQYDSFTRIYKKGIPDTFTVFALFRMSIYQHEKGNYDSAMYYSGKALDVADQTGSTIHITRALYNKGMIFSEMQQLDSSGFYIQKALDMAIRISKDELVMQCYNSLAINCNARSDYSGSVSYLLKAAAIIERSSFPLKKQYNTQTYGNIAVNLSEEKQYEKAIEYYKKALANNNYPEYNRFATIIHSRIFEAYMKLNRPEDAKIHLDSATLLSLKIKNVTLDQRVAKDAGQYYEETGKPEAALVKYLQAYQLSDSAKVPLEKAKAAKSLSQVYFTLQNYPLAKKYALEAKQISQEKKNYLVLASAFDLLTKAYSKTGDYAMAVAYADSAKVYSDSSNNIETKKITLSLESKYQNSKKETEIAALKMANAQQELAVLKRNRLLIIGAIASAALLLIVLLLYRNNRQRKTISEKEKEVQQQQIHFLEKQQQVISMQSMINGQETERTRIAKDLHDGLGGLFSTVKMYFSTLQHEQQVLQDNSLFNKSYELIDTASEEVRRIAHNMMPEVLMKLGLVHALQDMCNNVSAGKLLQVKLLSYGMDKRMNTSTEIMLYRIIQELLNNIIKHAQATEAIVQFNREAEKLNITVEDNGRGFNLQEADDKNHAGLDTIKSRVSYLNGNISIDSQKEIGTTVMMEFLINEKG